MGLEGRDDPASPRSIKLRHLVAPAFVSSLLVLVMAGLVWQVAWWLLLVEVSVYLLFALGAGWQAVKRAGTGVVLTIPIPLVFATIHLSWGSSFLIRLLGLRKQGASS